MRAPGLPGRQRRLPVWAMPTLLAVTATFTLVAAVSPPPGRIAVVACVQVLGVGCLAAAVRHHRPARPGAWWSLLAAALAYSLAWWCVLLGSGPLPVAALCLAAFVALGRVVVIVGSHPDTRAGVDRIDVALLAVSAAAVTLQLTYALDGAVGTSSPTTDTWVAAQAAGTVVFSATGLWAVLTGRASAVSARLLVLVATGLVVWHLSTLVVALTGTYHPGALVDVLVVPGWGALVAAAWQPTMRALGRPAPPSGRSFPGSVAVLGAAITLGVLPIVRPLLGSPPHPVAIGVLAVITVVLLLAREVLVARGASRLAVTDPLTGLGSRVALVRALSARATDSPRSAARLCVIDLEAFQDVNDTRGHLAGDQVLVRLAGRLADAAGPGASSYRLGGDEFAVLMPSAARRAGDVAPTRPASTENLLDAIAQPLPASGGPVRLRARIGEVELGQAVEIDPDDDAQVHRWATGQLADAELALAEARRRRVSAVAATPALLAAHRSERALAEQLPAALAGGAVVPHYQPLVGLAANRADDTVRGFEALARWEHPSLGLVGAEQVVPVAERLGVLAELDDAVLRAALADCARWRAEVDGWSDVTVWLNTSAAALVRADLVDRVCAELERAALPGRALVLEITENAWLTDRPAIAGRLQSLRSHGVRVAVDDFGSGYASLDYLVSFPVDALKVDRSLVERLGEPACARLLAGIVEVTHDLGIATLAEGVGTSAQVEAARALRFDLAQGYVLGRPLPASQVSSLATQAQPRPHQHLDVDGGPAGRAVRTPQDAP